jgi:hypothetical protein
MFESIRGHKIQFVIAAIAVAGMMMYAIPAPQLVIAPQDDDYQWCLTDADGAQFCYDTKEECENGRANDHPGSSECAEWHRH